MLCIQKKNLSIIMRHIYYSEDRLKLTNSLKPRFGHNHSQDTEKECINNSKVHVALNFTQGNKQLDAKPRYPFQKEDCFFIPKTSVSLVVEFLQQWVKFS